MKVHYSDVHVNFANTYSSSTSRASVLEYNTQPLMYYLVNDVFNCTKERIHFWKTHIGSVLNMF